MSAEIEKPARKGPARYFGDGGGDRKPKIKSDPDGFDGQVIQVNERPRSRQFGSNWQKANRFEKGPNRFNKGDHFKGHMRRDNQKLQMKIDPAALERHRRGVKISGKGVKTNHFKEKFQRKDIYNEFATEQAARTELLLNEEEGFIEAEDGVSTAEYTQQEIVDNVDITAKTKHFDLQLDFGSYRMRYTKNGRHLLIGGRKGHVAAFDWVTKRLHCEMNVMEEVVDVAWLHVETMYAAAQKNWVHFYDNQGTEVHCVKTLNNVRRMEFLPYHFLLVAGNDMGHLSWLDTSVGKVVANYQTRNGPTRMMAQNPYNGVMCLGSSKGVVTMWSPTVREPLAKMLCHGTPLCALTVDPKGTYLATSGLDKHVKIWDIRALSGPVCDYILQSPAKELAMSQRGLLALGLGNQVEIYRKPNLVATKAPYLRHKCRDIIDNMQFCPFEDVLGIGHAKGFTSLLVPGSGEPNFDALEANPFQTKSQRKENEVHALLDKVPPELIKLDPNIISRVDVPTLSENIEAKKSLLYLKAPKVDFKQRNKMKGKGGSVNAFKAKMIVKDQTKAQFIKSITGVKKQIIDEHTVVKDEPSEPVERQALDRFKPKKRKN